MTWSSTALRQFGRAIAYTMIFQLGLVLVALALFVAGRIAAMGTGLLGVLFTILASGAVVAFAIRWSPANAEVKASVGELEETDAKAKAKAATTSESSYRARAAVAKEHDKGGPSSRRRNAAKSDNSR